MSLEENEKIRLSISISKLDYENLNEIAEKNKVSLAWVAREAISEFLAKYRKGKKVSVIK